MTQNELEQYLLVHYPSFREVGFYYKELLKEHVQSGSRVLSAGCGHGFFSPSFFTSRTYVVGIDEDEESFQNNHTADVIILGNLEALPLADNVFDVIIAEWVFEHIENPKRVVSEFFRVLKPDGVLLFMTPNVSSPVFWFSKLLPSSLHILLREKLLQISHEHTFPAFYRLNTPQKIRSTFRECGFFEDTIIVTGMMTYFRFHPLIVNLGIMFNKLAMYPGFRWMKPEMTGAFRAIKEESAPIQTMFVCSRCQGSLAFQDNQFRCLCGNVYQARKKI